MKYLKYTANLYLNEDQVSSFMRNVKFKKNDEEMERAIENVLAILISELTTNLEKDSKDPDKWKEKMK